MSKHRIIHKIIFHARLETIAPFRIGNGVGEERELVILRRLGKPYLPASSLAGALRAQWVKTMEPLIEKPSTLAEAAEFFWGTSGEAQSHQTHSYQSHLRVFDMPLSSNETPDIVIRDGVTISPETGTAEDAKYYRYEMLEPGATFDLRMEITVRKNMDLQSTLQILHWLKQTLENDFRVGANTTKGFGRIKVHNPQAWQFEFPDHMADWIAYCQADGTHPAIPNIDFAQVPLFDIPQPKDFTLTASFSLKHSLIIANKEPNEWETDSSHLRSKGKPVISGKSLIGAMRNRARKILKHCGIPDPEPHLNKLFGAITQHKDDKPSRSRIATREADLSQVSAHEPQTRIRIDRFTGAPVNGGLFSSAPVWRKGNGHFQLWWKISDYADWEATLLLHLLKDLWTGDLALGGEKNIGRGVLQGHWAKMEAPDLLIEFQTTSDHKGLDFVQGKDAIQAFQKPLSSLIPTLNTPQP